MIIISTLSLIVAKAIPGIHTNINNIYFNRITSLVFLFASFLSLNTLDLEQIVGYGEGIGIYSGLFQVTYLTQFIEFYIYLIGAGILLGWPLLTTQKVRENIENKSTDYSLIVLFSILGSSLLISSFDLISIYLSIELQSFGLYILSTLYKDSESSTSAGLKYFLLGGLSSCLILLGIGIIYSYSGITNLESLYLLNTVIDYNHEYIIAGISLGLILIFIGFLFKIAAAPLHNWSPDVYDGTPTIVTTWLTIIPKIAILFLLLELQIKLGVIGGIKTLIISNTGYLSNLTDFKNYSNINDINLLPLISSFTDIEKSIISISGLPIIKSLLLISATLSLIIGSILGLAQTKIKRLLAYSTISHLGFMLLALLINTEQSIDSFIFYIIQYSLTNLNIFLVILGISYLINTKLNNNTVKDISLISELKGLFFSNPLLSIALVISLFSMAGIPPLIGFFSKQFVLYSALTEGYNFISLLAIIVSVISCSYYLQIIKVLFTNKEEGDEQLINTNIITNPIEINLTNTHSYLISTLTFIILLFFIKSSLILNSTQLLSLSLFYF